MILLLIFIMNRVEHIFIFQLFLMTIMISLSTAGLMTIYVSPPQSSSSMAWLIFGVP